MKNKLVIFLLIIVVAGGFFWFKNSKNAKTDVSYKKITPTYNDMRSVISTTGTIEPQNRLEIKPQISGRLEEVLVKEGQHVKKGQTLAWMSSTERAALLDSARTQGKESEKYWQDVYKPTPLISPIEGEVIVQTIRAGQTVSVETPVVVLSDRLIIKAQVDETDIGKIRVGQPVEISLDAYPENIFKGLVNHVAYESTLVNNVIIYEVAILPSNVSGFFRSGMGANVSIIAQQRQHVLTLPMEAITQEDGVAKVTLANGQKQAVKLGLSDDKQAEIVSGLKPEDEVLQKATNFKLSTKKSSGTNPFMPVRRQR